MVTSRPLEESDYDSISTSLEYDKFHQGTTLDFFKEEGTISNVYELENVPVLVVRGCKSLRLDIQYLDNNNVEANKKVMLEGFPQLVEQARANGFKEIVFCTDHPLLKRFCKQQLGFEVVDGFTLRKLI